MYHSEPYSGETEKSNLKPKDPDFWGLYGDQFVKKETAKKLDRWWKKTEKGLPRELPSSKALDRIFKSFDAALTKMADADPAEDMGITAIRDHVYVNVDSVYVLIANHYECSPKKIRDIFFEV